VIAALTVNLILTNIVFSLTTNYETYDK